jgi:hypothetical protein
MIVNLAQASASARARFFQGMFLKRALIFPENVAKTRVRNFSRQFFSNNFFGQFSNFQALLNHRANACSCFLVACGLPLSGIDAARDRCLE